MSPMVGARSYNAVVKREKRTGRKHKKNGVSIGRVDLKKRNAKVIKTEKDGPAMGKKKKNRQSTLEDPPLGREGRG